MFVGRDQAHSTLEVALQSDPGKQVAPDFGKQRIGNRSELELAPKEDSDRHEIDIRHNKSRRPLARRRVIAWGTLGLILILGAVLGGVLGSRHRKSVSSLNSPSNSTTTPLPVTPIHRNIAAVSFTLNSTNITRVYFQDDVGQIIEASNSESNNKTWSINKTGINGKNGSIIAAAVSPPRFPLVSLVSFYPLSLADINRGDQCILSRWEQPYPRHHLYRLDG